ncbi:MAG: hypothetical protein JJD92_03690 [Frankiaceae bacterium]|nr:hypothetical protein [Frankiaceae bacterium]
MSAVETNRVIRPSAIVPEHAARQLMAWVAVHDVTHGGVWAHDIGYFKRFSGPFNGAGGMRGSSVLLGTIHVTWDKYDVTIFRVSLTDEGVQAGMTVEGVCNELLLHAGLTLATCPRADLAPAPAPDPFKRPAYVES